MARDQFEQSEIDLLNAAIKAAENETSGEIRLHIENHCREELMDRAAFLFETLEMHQTEERNGVLFYLAIKDHQFAILGDVGINHKVPEGFWDEVRDLMKGKFKVGDYIGALTEGIAMSASKLKEHFPLRANDKNELSDEISFGA